MSFSFPPGWSSASELSNGATGAANVDAAASESNVAPDGAPDISNDSMNLAVGDNSPEHAMLAAYALKLALSTQNESFDNSDLAALFGTDMEGFKAGPAGLGEAQTSGASGETRFDSAALHAVLRDLTLDDQEPDPGPGYLCRAMADGNFNYLNSASSLYNSGERGNSRSFKA